MSKKGSGLIKILLFIILAGIIVSSIGPTLLSRTKKLSGKQAGEKAIAFIKENMKLEASFVDVVEESGMYKIKLKVNDQEFDSYVSKDGRFLFPSVIDLELKPEKPKEIAKTDKPVVQLYTMSFCPYGNQAEEVIKPVVDLLGESVQIEPHYVIYENYSSGYPDYCLDKENKYCSMHGVAELNQDIRELCVWQNQKDKFWPFLEAVNKDCTVQDIETCWQKVASKTGVDVAAVKSCFKENAVKLAQQEKDLNAKYQISGSPALLINEVADTGDRTPDGYKTAICNAFNNPPQACSQALEATASATSSGGCQ